MSKFEKFIVTVLIIFGIFMLLKKENLLRFSDIDVDNRELAFDKYTQVTVLDKIYQNIDQIKLKNIAGNINVEESKNQKARISVKYRIYTDNKLTKENILKIIKVKIKEGDILKINTNSIKSFPYKKLRIDYYLKLPKNIKLEIENHYGNIKSNLKANFKIKNKYGDIDISNAEEIVYLYNKYGNVEVLNSKCYEIETKYSKVNLKSINSNIKIKSKYSSFSLSESKDVNIDSKFTKLELSEIKGDLEISGSYKPINIRNIKGDIKIKAKFSKIRLNNIISKEFYLTNKYDNVEIKDIYFDNAFISLSNGNLKLNLIDLKDKLNIKNKYSDIQLNIAKSINPIIVADLKYGKFINKTDLKFSIDKKNPYTKILKQKGKQKIYILLEYGNFEVKTSNKL